MTDTQVIDRPVAINDIPEEMPANLPAPIKPAKQQVAPAAETSSMPKTKIDKIAGAISAVMGEVGIIAKDGVNQFHRYRYAQMQDVLQRLTPLMAKHGLMIMQTEVGRAMFDDDRAVSVQYQFTIAHSSGQVWPERPLQTGLSRCRDSKGGFDDKALNKCHTAARKYFLLALFQIATGDEDDADRGTNDGTQQRRPQAAPNVMRAAQYDPETGEIHEQPQVDSSERSNAATNSPPAADQPADGAPLSPPSAGFTSAKTRAYIDKWHRIVDEATNAKQLHKTWTDDKAARDDAGLSDEQFLVLKDKVTKAIEFLKKPATASHTSAHSQEGQ